MLGIPTVTDRVIQQAIAQVLSPIHEKQFSDSSYGFRPGRQPFPTLGQYHAPRVGHGTGRKGFKILPVCRRLSYLRQKQEGSPQSNGQYHSLHREQAKTQSQQREECCRQAMEAQVSWLLVLSQKRWNRDTSPL